MARDPECINCQVSVCIEDTGIGIAQDQLQNVFEPAFSRKGSRVRAKLGLFSSYQTVQKHGGEINIESEPGKGTAVTVIIPSSG